MIAKITIHFKAIFHIWWLMLSICISKIYEIDLKMNDIFLKKDTGCWPVLLPKIPLFHGSVSHFATAYELPGFSGSVTLTVDGPSQD